MTGVLVISESCCDRDADIEAPACTAQVAVLPPAQISLRLVNRLESAALNEALARAERQAGIIARLQGERPATEHRNERIECTWRVEFERGAERVTARQTQESASITISYEFYQYAEEWMATCRLYWERALAGLVLNAAAPRMSYILVKAIRVGVENSPKVSQRADPGLFFGFWLGYSVDDFARSRSHYSPWNVVS